MSKFILPEKWYIEGDESRKDAKDAWNALFKEEPGQSSNWVFYEQCFYYLNNFGKKTYSREIPLKYTKITIDEFLVHVIREKPFIQNQEYNEILIKLLTR